MDILTRRCFLGLASIAGLGAFAAPVATPLPTVPPTPATPPVPDAFPTQTPELAREMVGVSHANLARALLAHGARPSIFSAAMFGQLAVVKAFIEAAPGVQGTPGPHGITLLAHARAGVYSFGVRDIDRVAITIEKAGFRFTRVGTSARNLLYLGDNAFQPAGAPMVRVRFALTGDAAATELTVFDPEIVLRAARMA